MQSEHPLSGKKQSLEHVNKRVKAFKETIQNRDPEKKSTWLKNVSESLKGRVAWNKGLKGVLKAWNKGMKLPPEVKRQHEAECARKYRANNPRVKIDDRMSALIRQSLRSKKNGKSWESLVGYTVEDLMNHLEKQFTDGMDWKNIGEWHIDHIRPRSSFSYQSPEDLDFKKCWSLDNLQPLWAIDNLKKWNRYIGDI